jgi:hypothetical protein
VKLARIIGLASMLLFFFNACKNKDTTEKFGEVDLAEIAADTTMQSTIEGSFEFVKDLQFKNREVYSIVNGGYTGFKDVLITKRRTISIYDTLGVITLESERIVQAFLTDLDENNSPEIHIIVAAPMSKLQYDRVLVFDNQKWKEAKMDIPYSEFNLTGIHEWTSENPFLIHTFSIYDKSDTAIRGSATQYFKLKNNTFILEKSEATL